MLQHIIIYVVYNYICLQKRKKIESVLNFF